MITSIQNIKIKRVLALQQQKERKKEGLFVVEGMKMLEETPLESIQEVYYTEDFLKTHATFIEKLAREQCECITQQVFKHVSTFVTPQGIMAIVKQNNYTLEDLNLGLCPLIIALENLQDPGNMGTIIRTADATGASLIVSSGSVDIYNPKVVRATMGSIYRVPILTNVVLKDVLLQLKEKNIALYAAHLKGKENYFQKDYHKATCFIVGNEGSGLSDDISELATAYIKIPILGQAESLNASVAASVLMYEAIRQRIK